MNTGTKNLHTVRKALPYLIAAALLWPLATLAEGASSADHQNVRARARMVAFLNVASPDAPNTNGAENLVDEFGNPIQWHTLGSASVPLYTQNIFAPVPTGNLSPVLAPDGHHLTPSEWWQASGKARVTCLPQGTRYRFSFRGLVPDGVYTIWHFTPTGGGALASHPPADVNNVFMANDDGAAELSVIGTPGPATLFGIRPPCTLDQAEEFFVVLYHIDSNYCGPFPCDNPQTPAPTEVAHLFFRR